MTCIVGLVDKGKVWIGGDTAADGEGDRSPWKNSKVFKKDDFIFGYAGSFRFGQLIEHAFEIPSKLEGQSDMCYLVTTFSDSLITTLQNANFLAEDKTELPDHSGFLMGYHGVLYEFQEDFTFGVPAKNYMAIGSGGSYAIGAVHALIGTNQTPKTIITKALDAATMYCGGVMEPYNIDFV
jgi:ATP-dependent protease HslVU (ClpYQ) peptidase subunit